MNRRALEKHLTSHGCVFHHHGGKHDVWNNSQTLAQAPVPRHATLKRGTVRGICRMLGIPKPLGFDIQVLIKPRRRVLPHLTEQFQLQ